VLYALYLDDSLLAADMAMPCEEGHLMAVFWEFSYLKKNHNARIAFDPTYPEIDFSKFERRDWRQFYSNVEEPTPQNAPKPSAKPVVIRFYVDSDHAGDQVTRRSCTGFIMFINSAVINWYNKKKQGPVEGATFGSELLRDAIAMDDNENYSYLMTKSLQTGERRGNLLRSYVEYIYSKSKSV
jgi:hypothetical protein